MTEAFPWDDAPQYLIRDRDRIYAAVVTRRLRAMGIRDKPVPVANLIWLGSGSRIGRCCCVMRDLCRLIGWMVVDLIRSRAALQAEIWVLRQQINVLR
jgi:L-amino acid N-acyltransferase YncA